MNDNKPVVLSSAAWLRWAQTLEATERERDGLRAEVEMLRDTATLREKVIAQHLKTIEELRTTIRLVLHDGG